MLQWRCCSVQSWTHKRFLGGAARTVCSTADTNKNNERNFFLCGGEAVMRNPSDKFILMMLKTFCLFNIM